MESYDLNSFAVKCKNAISRQYIEESIRCYNANAIRSSIITCWLAIVYDYLEKLKQLSLHEDKEARQLLKDYEDYHRCKQFNKVASFEKDILTKSLNIFEFISNQEFTDLQRILDDRNRCAHPSHAIEDSNYEPRAEVAKAHIINAIELYLSQPAAYGKSTLDKIVLEFDQLDFNNSKEYIIFIENSALRKPKKSLINAFITICFKRILDKNQPKKQAHIIAALFKAHRELAGNVIQNLSESLASKFIIAKRSKAFLGLLTLDLDLFTFYPSKIQKFAVDNFIDHLDCISSEVHPPYFQNIIKLREFKDILDENIDRADSLYLQTAFDEYQSPKYLDALVVKYCNSSSFKMTKKTGRILDGYIDLLSLDQISSIHKARNENYQINNYTGPSLFNAIIKKYDFKDDDIEKLGIEEHFATPSDE